MARPTGPGWPACRQVGGNLPAHPIRGVPTLPRAVVHASCVLRTAPPPLALPRSAGCQPVVSPIANRRYAARMRRRVCALYTLRDCPGARRARLRVECGRLRLLFARDGAGSTCPQRVPEARQPGPRRGRGAGKKMSSAVSPPTPQGPPGRLYPTRRQALQKALTAVLDLRRFFFFFFGKSLDTLVSRSK
jgi:hypothetical protein